MKIINVEQGTIEWHEHRFGSVTGTRLQQALGAKWDARAKKWKLGDSKIQSTIMYELISERMSENEIVELNSPAVVRGNELEPFAVKAASETLGLQFDVCGMLASDTLEFYKVSPDAVHEENGKVVGGLETKCPSGKRHIEYLLNDCVPREYFFQVMSPMILSDQVKWWQFCSYDDRNYERPVFTVNTKREDHEKFIGECRAVLVKFLDMVQEVHAGLTF